MSKALESFAESFDAPFSSERHQRLESTAWMGGPLVEVRYYLGRLVGRNLFRESDAEVLETLVSFIGGLTSERGASLIRTCGTQAWSIAAALLRYEYEMRVCGKSIKKKPVAIVRAFLTDPSLTTTDLARAERTTEKQVMRNAHLTALLRQLAHLR